MNGRHPDAIRLTLTRCTDPAREAEFNSWYDRTHVPDIVSSGIATHGTRFADADPESDNPPYLALYELPHAELEKLDQAFTETVRQLQAQGRMFPALQIARRSMWRRIGGRFSTKGAPTKTAGLFIVESNCASPDREREFNDWYDRTHIPDLLGTGLFHTAHRFRQETGQGGGAYVAIYETTGDPLAAVQEFSRSYRPKLKAAGRLSDIIEVTWRGTYRRL